MYNVQRTLYIPIPHHHHHHSWIYFCWGWQACQKFENHAHTAACHHHRNCNHHHYHSASSSWSPAAPEYVLRCRGCWVPFSRPLENWSTSFCKSNQNLFCHHHDHRYDHDQWSLIIVFFETWTWKLFWRVDLGGRELFASSTQGSPDQKIRIKMIIMTTRHWKWF